MVTEHPRFTETTWADLGNRGLTRESAPNGWMAQHDLAVGAFEATREWCVLSFEEWRALVSAVAAGHPIILTHDGRTATFIVSQVISLSPNTTANLYVRTWGFAYPVSLGHLAAIEVPATTYRPPGRTRESALAERQRVYGLLPNEAPPGKGTKSGSADSPTQTAQTSTTSPEGQTHT